MDTTEANYEDSEESGDNEIKYCISAGEVRLELILSGYLNLSIVIGIASCCLNSAVVTAILKDKKLRETPNNHFVLAITLVDLFLGTLYPYLLNKVSQFYQFLPYKKGKKD